MAHKKGVGSSRNGRDSNAKRLGIKVTDGQSILAGGIMMITDALGAMRDETKKLTKDTEDMNKAFSKEHLAEIQ